jgi:valyl-tRNA synthetase
VAFLQDVIRGMRRLRAEMEISPRLPFKVLALGPKAPWLLTHGAGLKHLANVVDVRLDGERPGACATAVVAGAEIHVDLEGVVDVDAERTRLKKEMDRVSKDAGALRKKLGNQAFVAKAPGHVVAKFQEKLALADSRIKGLKESLQALG